MALFLLAQPLAAATINVGSNCSLLQAVTTVNTLTQQGQCTRGTGTGDIIKLPAGNFPITVQLDLMVSVTLQGAGMSQTKIQYNFNGGDQAINIIGPNTSPSHDVNVIFRDLTLQGLQVGANTTGIYGYNDGSFGSATLQLNSVRVTGFTWSGVYSQGVDMQSNGQDQGVYDPTQPGIFDSIIESNTSFEDGAGVHVENVATASIRIMRSTISNNSTTNGRGGGLYFAGGGLPNIVLSTFSGNLAAQGGGMYLAPTPGDYVDVISSTIAFNQAINTGGGVTFAGDGTANYHFYHCIVANNNAHVNGDADGPPPQANPLFAENSIFGTSQGLNLNPFDGGNPNLLDTDPVLNPVLVDAGGTRHTKVHVLFSGSPAIDYHLSTDPQPPAPTTDQRGIGFPRLVDGNGNGEAKYDIGAYEYNPLVETESMVATWSSGISHVVTSDSGYSGGKGTNLQATAKNQFVTYLLPEPRSGTYNVRVRVRKGSNRGKFQLAFGTSSSGPFTNFGAVQDLWASSQQYVELNLGNVSLTATKLYVRFTVADHGSNGTGFQLFLDDIKFYVP